MPQRTRRAAFVTDSTEQVRLTPLEKRSIVYARLPTESMGLSPHLTIMCRPDRTMDVPCATMAWIETLLANGDTDWPWFAAVLKFVKSPAYATLEKSMLAEIERERDRWDRIYQQQKATLSLAKQTIAVKAPLIAGIQRLQSGNSSVEPDLALWREQS